MEFGILGQLEVSVDGQVVEVRPAKLRALLAVLLVHVNEVVSCDRLAEALWGESPPISAANTLQGYVSHLRNILDPGRRGTATPLLQTVPSGYLLAVEAERVDAHRFERLVAEGRRALAEADPARATATLSEGLSLWRGPALAEFTFDEFARSTITRLDEMRLGAIEDRMDAELALGRHLDVLGEIKALAEAAPLRERRWGQLMLAHYRAGRQADALRAYQDLRLTLAEELGIDPSPELRRLEAAILAQDPALHPSPPASAPRSEPSSRPEPAPPGSPAEPDPGPPMLPPLPARLLRVGEFPFVARQPELESLDAEWARSSEGEQRLVMVAGESGVGKTRLAAEAAVAAHGRGSIVLFGRCDAELRIPYQPFAEALAELVHHCPPEQLRPCLGSFAGELARLCPQIASCVPDLPPPLSSDSETERYRLFDAFGQLLAALSLDAPLVFVVDDLQWAGRPALLLLRHLLQWPEPLRLLTIGTYCETELPDRPLAGLLGDLRRDDRLTRLRLGGLDDHAVGAFLEAATGRDLDERGRVLSEAVAAETVGNPFFLGEVVRHLRESGRLLDDEGRWVVTDRDTIEQDVPEGIRDVVQSRVSRLGEATNRMLVLAAVMGDEFELASLGAAAGFEEDELLVALEEAVHAALVVELASPPPRYRFAHSLVRASLYEQVSVARRAQLHRRVGEAIEAVHPSHLPSHLPQLAHHFARAAVGGTGVDKAIAYMTAAGDASAGKLAHDQAAAYYRQALELLQGAESDTDPSRRRCDLLLALGETQRRAGSPEYRDTLLEAAQVARDLGDPERLARAALSNGRLFWSVTWGVDAERQAVLEAALEALGDADSPARARLLANLAVERVYVGSYEENRRLSDEAVAMARRLGDCETLAWVLSPRYNTIWGDPSTLPERLANTAELLGAATQMGDPAVIGAAWAWRSLAAMEAGDVDVANAFFGRFESAVAKLRQPTYRWYLTYCQAGRMQLFGRLDEAERLAHEALELGTAAGHPDAGLFFAGQMFQLSFERGALARRQGALLESIATQPGSAAVRRTQLALLYQEADRPDDARRMYELVAADDFAGLAYIPIWLHSMANCASVCAYLGDGPRAEVLIDLIAPHADQVVTMAALAYSGSAAHYVGLLAGVLGDYERAEDCFAAAAAVNERIGAPTCLARTRTEWARLLLRQGGQARVARASELLRQAVDVGRDLGLHALERQALALFADANR